MGSPANEVTIFHNPRCSKSREALALLQQKGIQPRIVLYLEHPPTAKELDGILRKLGMSPRDLIRRKEDEYQLLGLENPALSREALIAMMVAHPRLIERPIVLAGGKAVLGRPPERVLDIL